MNVHVKFQCLATTDLTGAVRRHYHGVLAWIYRPDCGTAARKPSVWELGEFWGLISAHETPADAFPSSKTIRRGVDLGGLFGHSPILARRERRFSTAIAGAALSKRPVCWMSQQMGWR